MGGNEQKYINDAFSSNWIAPLGANVDGFEKDIETYLGVSHAAVLSSGTAAIHLAMVLLDVRPGDYVIVPSFTFSATVNPVIYQGAIPVLVESESDTWNMDPNLLEEAIKDCIGGRIAGMNGMGRKPKAIVPVYLYGMPPDMDRISEIAGRYDIPLVEDAAEAMGSRYKNKFAGTIGKMGVLSFNGNKIITTSGGGALVSDDRELISGAKFYATQARDNAPYYSHTRIGYNYRMSNIIAGVGRGQMEVLDQRVVQRRRINKWYRDILADAPGISFHSEPSSDYFSNFWLTCIVIDQEKSLCSRDFLLRSFEENNIEARHLWKPMHLQPVFGNCPNYVNGVSERLFNNGLCLPSGTGMNDNDFQRIEEVLRNTLINR